LRKKIVKKKIGVKIHPKTKNSKIPSKKP